MVDIRHYKDGAGNYVGHFDLDTGVDVSGYIEVTDPSELLPTWDGHRYIEPFEVVARQKAEYFKSCYLADICKSVTYTSTGGITKLYQANEQSQYNLLAMSTAYVDGAPLDFFWVSEDDTRVPFTLEDIKALAKLVGDQGWVTFQHLQNKKVELNSTYPNPFLASLVTW